MRHAILKTALLALLMLGSVAAPAKTVTDILNRRVTVPENPQRIVVGESRMIYTLALVEEGNPTRRIVGWPADLKKYDAQTWARYAAAFPSMADIPLIGNASYGRVSVEKVIALQPDLVILPVYAKRETQHDAVEQQLTAAGIPVIYIDTRVDLLHNTVPSLRLLGEVLNDQPKAARFITFYQQHMQHIADRLAAANPPKPRVMLQLHLGRRESCCTTVSHGNLADLLAFAGGDNIAAGRFGSVYGELNPEAVIAANPDIYVATGLGGAQALQLGPEVKAESARRTFRTALAQQPILSQLTAIKEGKTLAVWHNFYLSPWHLLDVELFAKRFHPALFHDLDPQETLDEMNRLFLPVPETGTYWTTTEPQ